MDVTGASYHSIRNHLLLHNDRYEIERALEKVCHGENTCKQNKNVLDPMVKFKENRLSINLAIIPNYHKGNPTTNKYIFKSYLLTDGIRYNIEQRQLDKLMLGFLEHNLCEKFESKMGDFSCSINVYKENSKVVLKNILNGEQEKFSNKQLKRSIINLVTDETLDEDHHLEKDFAFSRVLNGSFSCFMCGIGTGERIEMITDNIEKSPFCICKNCVDEFLMKYCDSYIEGELASKLI